MAGSGRDQRAKIKRAPIKGERRLGLRAAGLAGSRIAAPIIARHGSGLLGRLKAAWASAAGDDMAAVAWPASLGRDGALKLIVAPSAALELQHRSPLLIERINRFFGRDAVQRIVIVQGLVPRTASPRRAMLRPLGDAEAQALNDRLAVIDDPDLRGALAGLGRLVLGGSAKD